MFLGLNVWLTLNYLFKVVGLFPRFQGWLLESRLAQLGFNVEGYTTYIWSLFNGVAFWLAVFHGFLGLTFTVSLIGSQYWFVFVLDVLLSLVLVLLAVVLSSYVDIVAMGYSEEAV